MVLKELKELVVSYPWDNYNVVISEVEVDKNGMVTTKRDLGTIKATLTNSKKKTVSFVLGKVVNADVVEQIIKKEDEEKKKCIDL